MIEINLLPRELKEKESRFKKIDLSSINLQNVPVLKIAIAIAGVLIFFHLVMFFIGISSKANFNSLSKIYEKIAPLKKEADSLKVQVNLINKKTATIDSLMMNRFSWARKLGALSDSVTPGIWLSNLYYEEGLAEKPGNGKERKDASKAPAEKVVLKYMIISGYASRMGEEGTALIGRFIKSLKNNVDFYGDFSDIELGSIRSERVQNLEVMSFKITCLFKNPE